MLDYLCACLQPIGDDRKPEALYKAITRVFPRRPRPVVSYGGGLQKTKPFFARLRPFPEVPPRL